MKIKLNKIKTRNYLAIKAHFKNNAGSFKDLKKEDSKNFCRKNIDIDNEADIEYDDPIPDEEKR